MKTIKNLYGGDAQYKTQLSAGDLLNISLIEEAVTLLSDDNRLIPKRFKIKIPINSGRYLRISDCSLIFYRFFIKVPIIQYKNDNPIQETIIKYKNKQIRIYTSKN